MFRSSINLNLSTAGDSGVEGNRTPGHTGAHHNPTVQPIFPGVLIFPLPVAAIAQALRQRPVMGMAARVAQALPATPGLGTAARVAQALPQRPDMERGSSVAQALPLRPVMGMAARVTQALHNSGPGNGGSTNPGIPAILGSDYNTVGGIDAPPITISGGVDETDGPRPNSPPPPISPVPEPGSVVLLLTGVAADRGTHLRHRRSCRSKSD